MRPFKTNKFTFYYILFPLWYLARSDHNTLVCLLFQRQKGKRFLSIIINISNNHWKEDPFNISSLTTSSRNSKKKIIKREWAVFTLIPKTLWHLVRVVQELKASLTLKSREKIETSVTWCSQSSMHLRKTPIKWSLKTNRKTINPMISCKRAL